jgi:DNA-binding transcriptional MocR family regulator
VAPRGTSRQIADQLRELIRSGELAPGEMVPSEFALVEQHGVARGTVRAALAALVDGGLIALVHLYARQGRRGQRTDAARGVRPVLRHVSHGVRAGSVWTAFTPISGQPSPARSSSPGLPPVGLPARGRFSAARRHTFLPVGDGPPMEAALRGGGSDRRLPRGTEGPMIMAVGAGIVVVCG